MYSFTDYITEVGSRLSIFMAIVAFISQRILYPVFTKLLGNKLKGQELLFKGTKKESNEIPNESDD